MKKHRIPAMLPIIKPMNDSAGLGIASWPSGADVLLNVNGVSVSVSTSLNAGDAI